MSTGFLDPDEEALRGVVRALSNNCILGGATRRDEVEAVVAGHRDRYPGLTADLVRGAILVAGGSAAAPPTVPGGAAAAAGPTNLPCDAGTAPRAEGAWVCDAKDPQRMYVYWHGRLVQLPADLKFKRTTSFQLVQHWLVGDEGRNFPPLRFLTSRHFNPSEGGNKIRRKMKSFMRVVEEEARQKDVWIDEASDWDYRSLMRMWKAIADDFGAKYCRTKRKKEPSWPTVYNNMSKMNVFSNRPNKASKLGMANNGPEK